MHRFAHPGSPSALGASVLLTLLFLSTTSAQSAEALYLTWNQCGPGGDARQTFDCSSNDGAHVLYAGFSLDQPVDEVIGIEAVIDVQHSSQTLPSWWEIGGAGCRAGALTADDVPGEGCVDFWAGAASGGLQGFARGVPGGGLNQVRIKVALSVLSTNTKFLASEEIYQAARLRITNSLTTGTSACPGCAGGACLVLNSILIRRLPSAAGGDVFIQTPAAGNGNFALWQGGTGVECGLVSVHKKTWGQIKNLYR